MNKQALREYIGTVIVVVFLGALVGYARSMLTTQFAKANLAALMAGTGWTPFQYRWLSPQIFRLIEFATHASEDVLIMLFEGICFIATVGAMKCYAKATGLTQRESVKAAVAYVFLIPFLSIIQPLACLYYPYDSTSALFWALGLYALASDSRRLFILIYLIGLFNRESIVLLFVLSLMNFREKLSFRALAGYTALGAAMFLGSRFLAVSIYRGNPGAGVADPYMSANKHDSVLTAWQDSRLLNNLHMLGNVESLLMILLSTWFMWLPFVFYRKRVSDKLVRRSLMLIPLSFAIMMVVGNIDETRIFFELAPVSLIVMGHIIYRPKGRESTADAMTHTPGVEGSVQTVRLQTSNQGAI